MTTEKILNRKWLGLMSLALAAGVFALPAAADEPVTSPYATGGTVTRIDFGNFRASYIHVFTNTEEAATFASTGKRDLSVRYLVVGAGGAGGYYYSNSTYGGGGGGGGGVCEKDGIFFPANAMWQVRVGKGAADYKETAGVSSISNGVEDVETVPGGGNGASAIRPAARDGYSGATSGAAGGGAIRGEGYTTGAEGTYVSATLMDLPEIGRITGFEGGDVGASRSGGAGGGAGAAATTTTLSTNPSVAGNGIRSDITGETLFYGSGGGGGSGRNGATYFRGGAGGPRAGNGGVRNDDETVTPASDPEPNSGCGGGGGSGWGSTDADHAQSGGADGIVVIRYDVVESPCAGGDTVTRTLKHGETYTYIHTFTNSATASEFVNLSGRNLSMRYLVVGAGGAGTKSDHRNTANGGAGGGGGGVCERKDIPFAADATWTVVVGKGAADYNETAGASSISNGVAGIETVPGGGNGGKRFAKDSDPSYVPPTAGAAGGGGTPIDGEGTLGAIGEYPSSILGVSHGPFAGGNADKRQGGGGGGAGGAGGNCGRVSAVTVTDGKPTGGAGLASDITGESLVYGSGGGAGECLFTNDKVTWLLYQGGNGGARAGNGSKFVIDPNDGSTNYVNATEAIANSGGGGGGGGYGGTNKDASLASGGADGIVVIRYDFNENPQGFILFVR